MQKSSPNRYISNMEFSQKMQYPPVGREKGITNVNDQK